MPLRKNVRRATFPLQMRRLLLSLAAVLAVAAAPAQAAQSSNVKLLANIPEMAAAIAVNFIDDTMFVSTVAGVYAYDVSDPAQPSIIGALPMFIWENEDVDVDRKRKLLFVSRDPRGFTSPAAPGETFPYGAVHVIDVSVPHLMTQVAFFTVPAGHTTTCVQDCKVLWTAGPYANAVTQPDFVGRPVYGTDITDPANPKPCPAPIDTERNDGVTDYAHDVQVDEQGVAWVSGAGGVRGYWTSGTHRNTLTGNVEEATGCKPIPYAGSGTPESATSSRFMHNAWRDWAPDAPSLEPAAAVAPAKAAPKPKKKATKKKAKSKRRCTRRKVRGKTRRVCRKAKKRKPARRRAAEAPLTRNDVLFATEENIVSDCETSGRFVAYDLRNTYAGEGFKDIKATKHRMRVLDTWTPGGQEGATACDSSHYFTSRGDGITANAFYGQGVRFLDTSNPKDIRQVGYFLGDGANTWAAYWRTKDIVFVADFGRGIDVLQFTGGTASRTVRAPIAATTRQELRFSADVFGGLCPLRPSR